MAAAARAGFGGEGRQGGATDNMVQAEGENDSTLRARGIPAEHAIPVFTSCFVLYVG